MCARSACHVRVNVAATGKISIIISTCETTERSSNKYDCMEILEAVLTSSLDAQHDLQDENPESG